ncbi:MAG: DUF192 domain-containing protein [Polyangiaceae bacterium]
MHPRRLGFVAFAAAAIGLAACDHRDEPVPTPERPTPATSGKTGAVATQKPRSKPAATAPARCIKPTPEQPVRVVLGAIPDPSCPADPGPVPQLEHKAINIVTPLGNKRVDVEVAAKDEDRQRGLMYRTALDTNAGMLFEFEDERVLTFWMHNTCLPLDMIFIAKDGVIVGIEENTPTLSDQTFSPGCAASYVLEVNAGWTRKNGVRAGMKVEL